nr:immunoglobulin light chain junction region [Macaca mulatta]MOX34696.1 immunoglobulin light chain junction region [Macaca mulatta]MOX35000.1 immunoglobulin light chain junction region [Macaca mulatta]MOX35605.1 immunoglobulin light chain junction region [Macaca mulatta]MOX35705.1 immunoglobulin light chain junction region [Macaca mulatta]
DYYCYSTDSSNNHRVF